MANVIELARFAYTSRRLHPILLNKKGDSFILSVPGEKFDDFWILYLVSTEKRGEFCVYSPKNEDSVESCMLADSRIESHGYRMLNIPILEMDRNLLDQRKKDAADIKIIRVKEPGKLLKSYLIDIESSGGGMDRIYQFTHMGKRFIGLFWFKDALLYSEVREHYKSSFIRYNVENDILEESNAVMDTAAQLAVINLAEPFPFFMPE